ncbi:MAG: Holliday junction branch migration protein RuvA [bacterium]
MIGYLKGNIIAKSKSFVILEVNAVGYKVNTGNFPKADIGKKAAYFCYHYTREDTNELFGFLDFADLQFFELLLSVSGVGPKVAQTIMVNLGRDKIAQAISLSDVNLFKSIPGIGTKVASKIIVELKSKISKGEVDLADLEGDETVDALLALGLKKAEILPALKKIPIDLKDIQSRIKFVLKNVSK